LRRVGKDRGTMPLYKPQDVVAFPGFPKDRWSKGRRLLSDDRLRRLEFLLDEAVAIPGTGIRFGLDGIVGLVPGLGNVVAGIFSLIIPLAAWVRGVPYITVVRMLTNVSIGLLIGTIPVLGDAFDIFWKANRRNYRLLTRSIAEPYRHRWRDWAFLFSVAVGLAIVFALPLAFMIWLLAKLIAWQPFY